MCKALFGFTLVCSTNFPENPPNDQKFDHYCGDEVYVKTTEKYEENPSLQDKRKQILQELEDGDSETAKFADNITKKVLACQLETCSSSLSFPRITQQPEFFPSDSNSINFIDFNFSNIVVHNPERMICDSKLRQS